MANKIDLERSKVVKTEEGKQLALQMGCKFIEVSCTVGYNLDNLLVGLRMQLVLKHCVFLDAIFAQKHAGVTAPASDRDNCDDLDTSYCNDLSGSSKATGVGKAVSQPSYRHARDQSSRASMVAPKSADSVKKHQSPNIFVRFYRKLINDTNDNYECYNFAKL